MASSSRMALRRITALSARSSFPTSTTIIASRASVGRPAYSTFSKYQTSSLLFNGSRKTIDIQSNGVINQTRSYADTIVKVPQMAESISEGTLKQWIKKVGDYVKADEEIATIETDKIDVAVNAPSAGTITELLANEEDTVEVGQDLCKIDASGAAPEGGETKVETAKEEPKAPADPKRTSPPSGTDSTHTPPPAPKQEDSKPAPAPSQSESKPAPKPAAKPAAKPASSPSPPKAKSAEPFGERHEERVQMSRIRIRTAERLKESQQTAAALTTFNEVDMSKIMEFRKKYKDQVINDTGVKIGFLGAFSKAVTLAMKHVPAVNASMEGNDTFVFRDYVDISVAVATPKGLITPVVRNAETKSIVEIEREIAELAKKGRDGKITLEDLAGGTFTISNGGVFGSMMGTPIINTPQSAVLGLHATKERAVVVNGQIVVRPMMYLALTYDHRVLDGREAVTFLVKVKEFIEDPARMLLDYVPEPPKA